MPALKSWKNIKSLQSPKNSIHFIIIHMLRQTALCSDADASNQSILKDLKETFLVFSMEFTNQCFWWIKDLSIFFTFREVKLSNWKHCKNLRNVQYSALLNQASFQDESLFYSKKSKTWTTVLFLFLKRCFLKVKFVQPRFGSSLEDFAEHIYGGQTVSMNEAPNILSIKW